MLNCTDLACVLHHHHFYAHLHHLKNHLQDDNDNAVIGDGNNVSGNYVSEFDNNDVDSDLSSLSHVDAPSDTIYMVCGVVIAMLLVGLIIILVAVTISKLRKREETASATPATVEAPEYALQTLARVNDSSSASSDNSCCGHHETQQQQHQQSNTTSISTSTTISSLCNNTPSITIIDNNGHHMNDCNGHHINYNNNNNNNTNNNNNYHNNSNDGSDHDHESVTFTRTSGGDPITNGWVFPPKAPTPNIYNFLNQDLLEAAGHGHNGFKGFRKQFSGRFKRLVSKKSEATSPIPPELKPQLKTIYVY